MDHIPIFDAQNPYSRSTHSDMDKRENVHLAHDSSFPIYPPVTKVSMAQDHYFPELASKSPLTPDFYNLRQDERENFQNLTGIADDDALRAHIITVQTKAYEVTD